MLSRRRKWLMCGGPAADRTSAGRVMIATAIAIRTVPRIVLKIAPRIALMIVLKRVRCRPPQQIRLMTAPGASAMDADGATATMISVSPAPMRRWNLSR
jgi:hypothetical protein